MAKTLDDVLLELAYRLGEDSSPTDSNEKARRIRYINEAQRKVAERMPFWFSEETYTDSTVASQEEYTLPSNYRDMVEVRVDGYVYTPIAQHKVFGLYDQATQIFNYGNLVTARHWYIFDNSLHLLPAPSANGTNNITLKYYRYPTEVSAGSDTFLVPDAFIGALAAFAYARKNQYKGKRGEAADGFAEFSDILKSMVMEQNRQRFSGKNMRPTHPSYLVD